VTYFASSTRVEDRPRIRLVQGAVATRPRISRRSGLFVQLGEPGEEEYVEEDWRGRGRGDRYEYLYVKYHNFNEDISAWDMSLVTTMRSLFRGCRKFSQPIGSWYTSRVTDMSNLFGDSLVDPTKDTTMAFNQDIGAWDTSSVTDMSRMFSRCVAFNADISAWNTSSAAVRNNKWRKVGILGRHASREPGTFRAGQCGG